ncbi:major facilitator superfamily domain-containing protein [Radiomyces spectabilis]|uniref:major facilitator superfamily domain-containing protein n=1 Tax=Radiomyces spectabilis TaxID=64574 RepID=UPI00221F5383|nr:major facilitator superfamily domain-containing protein [Radiomyces spectabilis]KAI8384809.1 major facilitator superfamily domain-containing protein [Radiomyces spectabilis]
MDISSTPRSSLPGVKKVLIAKKLASRTDLFLIIFGIVAVAWAKNWEGNVVFSVTPLVTSLFDSVHISSILDIVLYILVTVLLPFYSKFADMVGRTEAFTVAIVFYVVSGTVQATAQNLDTLVGGQVLYSFGYAGVHVLGHVLIADMTSRVNRGLFQAFYDVPAIVNIFVAPFVGDALWRSGQWRWTYSMIPFGIGLTSIPLLTGLFRVEKKVKKSGLMKPLPSDQPTKKKSVWQHIVSFAVEMDVIGSILFVGALCLIMLPLVLALSRFGGWGSPTTIGTIVGGVVCLLLFGIWEWKFAEKPLVPMASWDNPTPFAGVLTCSTISIIAATNWQYFLVYLQISRKLGVIPATLLVRGYDAAFLISQVLAGFLMKRYKIYRPFVLGGICLLLLGIGLMIPARFPNSATAFLAITQVIAGLGAGMIYVPILVAVQSSVPHKDLAIVTAFFQIGGTIATSIGSTVAGAIWNSMLPDQIAKHVPGDYIYEKIVGDIGYATSLPAEQFAGVVTAYGNIQRILSIVSLCLAALALLFFLGMRSFGLEEPEEDNAVLPNPESTVNAVLDESSTTYGTSKMAVDKY